MNDYPIDSDNFQPRVGLSYSLDQAGRRLVRGGYGRFYDKTHFEIIGGLFNNGALLRFVHGQLPDHRGGSRPAPRTVPDRPVPRERTGPQSRRC